MPVSFSQLAAFRAVADAGGVGRGAEKLLVSQPAVSKHIRQLERTLGVALFDRTPKGVRPTHAGELLADYARRIFALADEAEQAVADLRGLRRGKLAIAASPTLGVYFLPGPLVRFRRDFPDVTVAVEVENSTVLQRRLLDGDVELGFSEVQPQRREIDAHVFLHDQLIAVASPRHPLAKKHVAWASRPSTSLTAGARARRPSHECRSIALADLARQPFVVRETGSTTKSMVERALADRGLAITPVMSLGSTEAIKQAVRAGLGLAVVSRAAVEDQLAAGTLAALRVRDWDVRRALTLLRLRGRVPTAAAHRFEEALGDEPLGDEPLGDEPLGGEPPGTGPSPAR